MPFPSASEGTYISLGSGLLPALPSIIYQVPNGMTAKIKHFWVNNNSANPVTVTLLRSGWGTKNILYSSRYDVEAPWNAAPSPLDGPISGTSGQVDLLSALVISSPGNVVMLGPGDFLVAYDGIGTASAYIIEGQETDGAVPFTNDGVIQLLRSFDGTPVKIDPQTMALRTQDIGDQVILTAILKELQGINWQMQAAWGTDIIRSDANDVEDMMAG